MTKYHENYNNKPTIVEYNDKLIINTPEKIIIDPCHILGASYVTRPLRQTSNICGKLDDYEELASHVSATPTPYWCLFVLPIIKDKQGDVRKPLLKTFQFYGNNGLLNVFLKPQKPILFLLNPAGGQAKAKLLYLEVVLPLLTMSSAPHELMETKRPEHAIDIGKNIDIDKYKAIVTISGDGVFHELLTGLATRPDYKKALQLPIGMIGAGSGNGLSKNLDMRFPAVAVLSVIQCHTRPVDIFSVIHNNKIFFSHLCILWGLLADVDIESNHLRYLGEIRFVFAALIRLVRFRNYFGKLYMLPPHDENKYRIDSSNPNQFPLKYTSPMLDYTNWPMVIDGSFQYFTALNMPWISSDFLADPLMKMDNGVLSLIWSEKITRTDVLACILDQSQGNHLNLSFIKRQEVVAFVLEPEGYSYKNPQKGSSEHLNFLKPSIVDISGEEVGQKPIYVEVHPRAMNLIMPSWLDDDRWQLRFNQHHSLPR